MLIMQACLISTGFTVIIVDESHNLRTTKNNDSNITEVTVGACKKAKRVIMLTGTPSLSRPFDLFRQVCILFVGHLNRKGRLCSGMQSSLIGIIKCAIVVQVDGIRSGILGKNRDAFSKRYCNRRLIPAGKSGNVSMTYDNSGLSYARELHLLLKQVDLLNLFGSNLL